MSTGANLQRSSWKAEAIRRGDLKISGPIPLAGESPLEKEEVYTPKLETRIETAIHEPQLSPKQPLVSPTPAPAPIAPHDALSTVTGMGEVPSEHPENVHSLRHKMSSERLREASESQRQSIQPLSEHQPSPMSAIARSSTTMAVGAKKRKGSIRNVFRKMFGRRSREKSPGEADPVFKHGHHRSEPVTIHESPKMTREDVGNGRISDLPVRELEPMNPLGQHLPFPMNVNAPQEISPPHDYLTFETRPQLNQRRATLPSLSLSNVDFRPDDKPDDGSAMSPQIGIALSSPPYPQSIQSKRRSRSAGALRDLANVRPSVERRRSAEIRYWRSSYQSGSVYSTVSPRPQTAISVQTVKSTDGQNSQIYEQAAEQTRTDIPAVAESTRTVNRESTPEGEFNFGDLRSSSYEREEIHDIEASVKRLSVEERVQYLEENMRVLETSVRRISGRSNRHTIILESAPSGQEYRNRASQSPRSNNSHGSRTSGKGSVGTASTQNHHPEPPSPALAAVFAVGGAASASERPQTIFSVEHDVAQPSANTHSFGVAQELAKISEALKCERAARKALEQQVDGLQRELADLHAIVGKIVARSPSYPTPSPDVIITTTNDERLATPRAESHPGRLPGLEVNEETPKTQERLRETIISRFSQSDSEQEDCSVSSSREDLASQWATPKEESGFGSGFFSPREA